VSWYQRLSPAGLCVTCEAPAAVRNGRRILRCDSCARAHNAAARKAA
jgi:ribosomal protein L37AE/L43A